MERIYLIGIIILLSLFIFFICKSNNVSTFGADATSQLPTISKDTTMIFHAPWCGHCKNSMEEFKQAVKDGNGKVVLIDSTDESNTGLVTEYGVNGFPTIMKGGVKYSGERKADAIVKFSKS